MVRTALDMLVAVLNAGLGVDPGEEPIAVLDAPLDRDLGGGAAKLRVSLIKVDRDVTVQVPKTVVQQKSVELRPPPLRVNMDVLIATAGAVYEDRLDLLEEAMRILHSAKSVQIGGDDDPAQPRGSVQIELQNLDLQALSHIWSASQARLAPHALYRLRGVQIVDSDQFMVQGVIQDVNLRSQARRKTFAATVLRHPPEEIDDPGDPDE